MAETIRILGLDPGLRRTGWGVIESTGSTLTYVASGACQVPASGGLPDRLAALHRAVSQVAADASADEAAVEETFVNANPASTLKLGQARGVVLCAAALSGCPVAEYAPNQIKKTVVGSGHAQKQQIETMIAMLLPKARPQSEDEADALAVAICHAHQRLAHPVVLEARAVRIGKAS
jgi:crossover junction endodeoxyribonuclease RuvC